MVVIDFLYFFLSFLSVVFVYTLACVSTTGWGGLANNERREEEPEKPCKMPIKIKTGNIINEMEGGRWKGRRGVSV